jgi:hypothetical protein
MDTASFFFSFESDLPEIVLRLVSDGLRKVPQLGIDQTLASPVFIVQNEACLPWHHKPRHHTSTGRDWPHKRVILPELPEPDLWGLWWCEGDIPPGTGCVKPARSGSTYSRCSQGERRAGDWSGHGHQLQMMCPRAA